MKLLKHIISWVIWSVLALYMLALICVQLPSVQSHMGRWLSSMLGEKLGTEVSVGRISLGFLNRIIIDDVNIKDRQQQDMLRINRLTARLQLLPLLEQRIDISSAQIFGAHAKFYKTDSLQPANYQFVIDALSSEDTTAIKSNFDVKVNSLLVRNSSIKWDEGGTPGRHYYVSDVSAYLALKVLRPDSINVKVKRLTLQEQGGLKLKHLAAHLEANQQAARLTDFELRLPHSTLRMDSLTASYQQPIGWQGLSFRMSVKGSTLTPSDLAFLESRLQPFDQTLHLNIDVEGNDGKINVPNIDISSADGTLNMQARAAIINNKGKALQWKLSLHRLDVAGELLADFELPDAVKRMGNLHLTGDADHLADGTTLTQGDLLTDAGRLTARLTIDDDMQYAGHLSTDSLMLARVLDNDDLGLVATQIEISGNRESLQANGSVGRFDFKGYPYQNIMLDMAYKKGDITGKMSIDDPNIKSDIEGRLVDFKDIDSESATAYGHKKSIRLTGTISDLSPRNLHLTDRWGDATFTAIVDADVRGSQFNDLQGSIDVDDFCMMRTDSTSAARRAVLSIDNLHLKSGYDDDMHYLRLTGDIGEINLTGQFDWATLPQSVINFTASKIPTLPGLPETRHSTHNNFEADVRLNDTQWLQQLLNVPLDLHRPLHLNAIVNDEERVIDINGLLPSFSYNESNYSGGRVDLTTHGDTALCNMSVTRLDEDNRALNLQLQALAADNNLETSVKWDNHTDMSGQINTIAQLYTNEHNKSEAHVRMLPSHIMLKNAVWELEPADVLISDGNFFVDFFNLHHKDQHLIIDGVASGNPRDTLLVDMKDIDVRYVLDLVNFHSVDFGGLVSGRACLVQPLDKSPKAWADITVKDFEFLEGAMGTLQAQASWNNADKQIDINAVAQDDRGGLTMVDGYVSPARSDIHLDIEAKDAPATFIEDITKSFIGRLDGRIRGHIVLAGPLGAMNLTGKAAVDAEAFITPLNTTYRLKGDTVRLLPNEIVFDNWRLHDRRNQTGILNGAVHHHTLKDFTFDFDVETQNLLAYDFPDFDGGTICGTVYATGHADIHGRPNEVTINCDVTPEQNSFFAYNAANPDAISSQQFITWGKVASPSASDGTTTDRAASKTTERLRVGEGTSGIALSGTVDGASGTSSSDLYINFRINATPDATLRVLMDQHTGDYITLNGNGVLRASFYDKGPFQMFGTYQVERGTYGITIQNIIKKNFTFQNGGTIVFGGDPFDANLNLLAQYTVNGVSLSDLNIGNSFTNNTVRVNCLMNIQGTAGQPRVDFDLEMPTVNSEEEQMIRSVIASEQELNQQVVYLLGIGRFYTQGVNNAGTQQYGQTELAMQSFLSGTVSTQINELLSQVIKSNDWNFGANISTGNEGWHNAEYEGLISGRMLNNRLLINGQFGYRDNATQASPSFIGDFDIRYLLTPNGNLALKVYNQTNDRYFTRSSLNTQGIGIIMKRDFNGLGDLFHPRRKKSK